MTKETKEHGAKTDPRTEKANSEYLAIYADLLMRVPRHEICKKHNCSMRTISRAVGWVKDNALKATPDDERMLLVDLMEKLAGRLHERVGNLGPGTGFAQAETAYIKQLVEIEKYLAELRGLHRLKVEVEHTGEVTQKIEFDPKKERAILAWYDAGTGGTTTDTGGSGQGPGSEETPSND